jgi:hypothetical protein
MAGADKKKKKSQKSLFSWRRANPNKLGVAIQQNMKKLKELQEATGEVDLEETCRLQVEAQVLMEKDETKWRQRAKEIRLKCGDKN